MQKEILIYQPALPSVCAVHVEKQASIPYSFSEENPFAGRKGGKLFAVHIQMSSSSNSPLGTMKQELRIRDQPTSEVDSLCQAVTSEQTGTCS